MTAVQSNVLSILETLGGEAEGRVIRAKLNEGKRWFWQRWTIVGFYWLVYKMENVGLVRLIRPIVGYPRIQEAYKGDRMSTRTRHYAVFFSPGTFVPEQSWREIDEPDVRKAAAIAAEIVERYNAKPYCFRFVEMLTHDPVPDGRGGTMKVEPKELRRSGSYFLGGRLRLYDEVVSDNREDESILRSNMRCNNMWVVVENTNSWKFTGEFGEDDVLLSSDGDVVERGNSRRLMEYRRLMNSKTAGSKVG